MQNFIWYVAGPWIDRPNVREIIEKVKGAGWVCNSRWADLANGDIALDDPDRGAKLREQAARDVEDVVMADGLLYINSAPGEGKATELGLALAMLKPIVVVGERHYPERVNNNIFLNLDLPIYPTIDEALEWLKGEGTLYIKWALAQQWMHIQRLAQPVGMLDPAPGQMALNFPSE